MAEKYFIETRYGIAPNRTHLSYEVHLGNHWLGSFPTRRLAVFFKRTHEASVKL